jgi:hypothetical protein
MYLNSHVNFICATKTMWLFQKSIMTALFSYNSSIFLNMFLTKIITTSWTIKKIDNVFVDHDLKF